MSVLYLFFVVAFWAFVFCEFCLVVAAMRSREHWFEMLMEGTPGAIWVSICVAFVVIVAYAIVISHVGLFGGGA